MASDNIENNLRFLFTWPDATLENDWRSTLGPIRFPGDSEALESIVRRYLKLRRKADDWKPRRYDNNNHRQIAKADILALLADAQRCDRGEAQAASGKRRPGRPSKADGKATECAICKGIFRAKRATARYCGDACRQQAQRDRRRGQIRHANPRETTGFSA